MVCVRPGVLLVRARPRLPRSALIALDLPTFERPAKAISGTPAAGRSCGRPAARRKAACEKAFMGTRILIKSRLSRSGGIRDGSGIGGRGAHRPVGGTGLRAGREEGAGHRGA